MYLHFVVCTKPLCVCSPNTPIIVLGAQVLLWRQCTNASASLGLRAKEPVKK
jgi:hypothetical protein